MSEPPAGHAIRENERELWDELNRRMQEAVPKGANVAEAQFAMAAALTEDAEIKRRFDRVAAMAFHGHGFLHELFEDLDAPPSLLSGLDKDDYGPIDIDIEETLGTFVGATGERLRISLLDSKGEQIASLSGVLSGFEAIDWEGKWVGNFLFSRDHMSATIRIPIEPETRCMITPDGCVTGELPDGSRWAIVDQADETGAAT